MFHLGYEELEHSLFWQHFTNLEKLFELTVSKSDSQLGGNLVKNKKLLRWDSSLFVQYVLGQYLSCTSAWGQIEWLTLIEIPRSLHRTIPFLRTARPADLKLFHDAGKYEELCLLMGVIAPAFLNTPVIAYSILFRSDVLKFTPDVDRQLFLLKEKDGTTSKILMVNFRSLMARLEQMKKTFQETASWAWNQNPVFQVGGCFKTTPEELWFQTHAYCVGKTYESMSLGSELIKEFVVTNMTASAAGRAMTPSKRILSHVFNVVAGRMLRILWIHDSEKKFLSRTNKVTVSESVYVGVAVWWARFEGIKNGNRQLDFMVGK